MKSTTDDSNYVVSYRNMRELPMSGQMDDVSTSSQQSHTKYSTERVWHSGAPRQEGPVSVFDAAKYILKRLGSPCSTMKLHKLLYYSQAWSMVWEESPLFFQPVEAWANGPVIRQLFNYHRGLYQMGYNDMAVGNEDALSATQKADVDEVLDFYGGRSAQWLIDQTHIEAPWKDARKGLASNERGNNVITLQAMQEYYSSLC